MNDDELLALRQWAKAAYAVIRQGIYLIDAEQLRQWEGVRAVVESAPSYVDDLDESPTHDGLHRKVSE